jgi:hypothetical protein
MVPCPRDHMVWATKRDAVAEHQSHVRNELLCAIVTWIVGVGIWLGRIRQHELTLNSAEVHWVLDYAWVTGNVERNGIDGTQECASVLRLLE